MNFLCLGLVLILLPLNARTQDFRKRYELVDGQAAAEAVWVQLPSDNPFVISYIVKSEVTQAHAFTDTEKLGGLETLVRK
jgi:hypothetical protein